jgi:hypothetical protein
LARALLLVISGGLFWMVALGPEKCAIRGLDMYEPPHAQQLV